jgi:hypothetical protein
VLTPILLLLGFWLSCGWFIHLAAGWNVNTRLALTYAIVEKGTFTIDAYHDLPILSTGDKAFYGGHYYCDKAPALSFSAVPLYYVIWRARLQSDLLGEYHTRWHGHWVYWTRWLLTFFSVCLPAALLGVLLWRLALVFGAPQREAILLSIGMLLGTVLFGYATLFYAYLPSAFFSVLGYYILLKGRLSNDGSDPRHPPLARGMGLFWAGLCVGLAWFYEFTSGLVGLGLGVYALWTIRHRPAAIYKFVGGGLIPVLVLYSYTWSIFGELAIPYQYEVDDYFREEMAKGFQGIHAPRLGVLFYVTFHPFKGLFFYSPFLLLGVFGAFWALLKRKQRPFLPDTILSIYIIAAYLAFNSGYYMWWGGWASGPRLLCPAIPFFLPPLAQWLSRNRFDRRAVFVGLLVVSLLAQLIITSTDPQVPDGIEPTDGRARNQYLQDARLGDSFPSPILNALVPMFLRGELARNLGMEFLGWPGRWGLLPLWTLWSILALFLYLNNRKVGIAKGKRDSAGEVG